MNFKIVSWNVENLFHPASSSEEKREYGAKIASLASAVRSLAPDVIALQEIGGPEALADLLHPRPPR